MPLQFVFRVDSSPAIGSGHLMRCITLADALSMRGQTCLFICRDFEGNQAGKIKNVGHEVRLLPHNSGKKGTGWLGVNQLTDADQTVAELKGENPAWMIVDHYGIDIEWENAVAEKLPGTRILVIDDLADRKHACDVLMDLSPGRSAADYAGLVGNETRLHIGLEYALLRPDFSRLRAERRRPKSAPGVPAEILVTFGGGENRNALEASVQALLELEEIVQFNAVIVGGDKELVSGSDFSANVIHLDYADDMAFRIANSDLMICAAGGTSWERCCLGIPAVVLTVAENQLANAKAIAESGAGIFVETDPKAIRKAAEKLLRDNEAYSEVAKNAWQLCDGNGAARMATELLAQSAEIVPVTKDDARFVYDARYSGGAERYYKNPRKPAFDDHVRWLSNAVQSDAHHLFIVELGGERIAHVRLDTNPDDFQRAEIGIAMAPEFRGKGLALAVLKAAVDHSAANGFKIIDAEVHRDNAISIRLFEAGGFALKEGQKGELLHYQLHL